MARKENKLLWQYLPTAKTVLCFPVSGYIHTDCIHIWIYRLVEYMLNTQYQRSSYIKYIYGRQIKSFQMNTEPPRHRKLSPCVWAHLGQVNGKTSSEVKLVLCVVQKPPAITPLSVLWCFVVCFWLLQTCFLHSQFQSSLPKEDVHIESGSLSNPSPRSTCPLLSLWPWRRESWHCWDSTPRQDLAQQ